MKHKEDTTLKKYTFITTPMLNGCSRILHKGAQIEIRGTPHEHIVYAGDKEHMHDVVDDFVLALIDSIDPNIQIKNLKQANDDSSAVDLHPSSSNWAYSKIHISYIPSIDISDNDWERVRKRLTGRDDNGGYKHKDDNPPENDSILQAEPQVSSPVSPADEQADEIIGSIGNTRIVKLEKLTADDDAAIYAKCEFENPSGSHKDRIFYYIIDHMEREGKIKPGMTLVDCSTGNGGAALALIGTAKGYNVTIVMPEGMTEERKLQIRSYGAQIIETPASLFLNGAVERANKYVQEDPAQRYFLDQSNNYLNADAWKLCGKEIVKQFKTMGKTIDAFICSIGTGGTFSGIIFELKKRFPDILSVAIEVNQSAPLSAKRKGETFIHHNHNLMGLGSGVLSPNTMEQFIDKVETVSGDDSWKEMKEIIKREKLMVGPTCGANLFIARKYAKKMGKNKTILTLFFDSSWKYFSRWNGGYPEYE